MPIPDYQAIMLPLLKLAADGNEHHIREAIGTLANQFGLSESEQKGLLPSGSDFTFDNRVGWARTYLKKAGLIQYTRRGYFQITDRGSKVLAANPAKIDVKLLRQFPEFEEFYNPEKSAGEGVTQELEEAGSATPEELLASGYSKLRKRLEFDILSSREVLTS